ncbi:hypothetical protein C8F01DRAFT_142738 [Mycena amicta]|nr:hypothetical protein C8F01DRAFT_142738 [Mycena amicta]
MEPEREVHTSPHRHEDLWFSDGTIVLQAGDTQYRVYRGTLERYSPVLKQVLLSPPDHKPIEGCVVLHLEDPAVNVTAFLKALFDPEFLPLPERGIDDVEIFYAIRGCLLLAHKYQVGYLRRYTLGLLGAAYPTTFEDWLRIDLENPGWRTSDDGFHNFFMLHLAREVDALWLLPAAFNEIHSSYPSFGDISMIRDTHELSEWTSPATVSVDDQNTFFAGLEEHYHGAVQIMEFLSSPPHIPGCGTPERCPLIRFETMAYATHSIESMRLEPLHVWSDSDWKKLRGLCPKCLQTLKLNHAASRRGFWNNLPKIYGLPPWNDLEAMKKVALGSR